MIFQQRINIVAAPLKTQEVETSLQSLIYRFFLGRAERFKSDSAYIRKIDYENEVVEVGHTHIDMIVTVEADNLTFLDLFLKSFLRRDSTYPFQLIRHDYQGI